MLLMLSCKTWLIITIYNAWSKLLSFAAMACCLLAIVKMQWACKFLSYGLLESYGF